MLFFRWGSWCRRVSHSHTLPHSHLGRWPHVYPPSLPVASLPPPPPQTVTSTVTSTSSPEPERWRASALGGFEVVSSETNSGTRWLSHTQVPRWIKVLTISFCPSLLLNYLIFKDFLLLLDCITNTNHTLVQCLRWDSRRMTCLCNLWNASSWTMPNFSILLVSRSRVNAFKTCHLSVRHHLHTVQYYSTLISDVGFSVFTVIYIVKNIPLKLEFQVKKVRGTSSKLVCFVLTQTINHCTVISQSSLYRC